VTFALASALLLTAHLPTLADDWPQWRGPTTLGYTHEKGLPIRWDGKTGENVLWKVEMPKSHNPYSSPIVSNGRVFVMWSLAQPPEHHLTCYDKSDGKRLWDTVVPPGKFILTDLRGGYGAPTPCADGERVYVVFGSAVIAALDFDGHVLWRRELSKTNFGVARGSSPILYQDTVVYLADQNMKTSSLIAFDKKTGNVKWEALRPDTGFAHTTPALVAVKGQPQFIIGASSAIQGVDPATGKVLWWCKNSGDTSSPAFGGGLVYNDSGRGSGNAGAAVDPTGVGDVTATHLKWRSDAIRNDLGSPIIVGEYPYRLDSKNLQCIRLATGEIIYRAPLEGLHTWVSPIATPEGHTYYATSGRSYVLKAGPKLEVLAKNDLGDQHFSMAAVSDGRLYLRGPRFLFCVGAK
jgi:outer membrane protein assembly factor BamB